MRNYKSYDDSRLTELLKQSDESAFTEIYDRYWERLYSIAHKRLESVEASEEIVQEIFIDIWEKRESRNISNISAYLATATKYKVYHLVAKKYKAQIVAVDSVGEIISDEVSEDVLWNRFMMNDIASVAKGLPEKCQVVFIHNKLLDLPLQDIADQLNISLKTAEAHLTKALKRIREKFPKQADVILVIFIMSHFAH